MYSFHYYDYYNSLQFVTAKITQRARQSHFRCLNISLDIRTKCNIKVSFYFLYVRAYVCVCMLMHCVIYLDGQKSNESKLFVVVIIVVIVFLFFFVKHIIELRSCNRLVAHHLNMCKNIIPLIRNFNSLKSCLIDSTV